MMTAEQSFNHPHPSMLKYLRQLDPVSSRALVLGERLRNLKFELLTAKSYVKLEAAVAALEKFFDGQDNSKRTFDETPQRH